MELARARGWAAQTILVIAILAVGAWLAQNLQLNLEERNLSRGFEFLLQPAGFAIGEASIDYQAADSFGRAILVGILNTLKIAILAIITSTVLGFAIGLGRLSHNALLKALTRTYVEAVRNVPLLLQLLFLYALILYTLPTIDHAFTGMTGVIVSNRGIALPALAAGWPPHLSLPQLTRFGIEGGWVLSAELLTLLLGLSLYAAAYIAEIVRAGVLSVPEGQREASTALGMRQFQQMRYVIMPQAMRAIVPPMTSWHLNTVKNSSLAIAVGYPDLVSVIDTIINQTGQAIEGVAIMVAVYLMINLLVSAALNSYNARITRTGPAATDGARRSRRGKRRTDAALRSLFSSPSNAITSSLLLVLLILALWQIVNWAVISAAVTGDSGDCRAVSGACWPFIRENYREILFGTYPHDERWRGVLVLIVFFSSLAASFWTSLWNRRLVAIWATALVIMVVLMRGGVAGLESVPTGKWSGLPLTLLLASLAVVLAMPLAVLLALGRRSRLPVLRGASIGFIEIVRGVPLVGVLFLAAVMFPLFMPPALEINSYLRVQIALVLFTAAYMAEVVRGGLQAVPNGQYEAAMSLGLTYSQTISRVVLPQALKVSVPGIVNTSISEIKNTTLVLIVGIFDVLQTTRLSLVDVTWRPFFIEAYTFTALIFFCICFAISNLSFKIERHLEHGRY